MQSTEQLAELIERKHQILVQLRDVGKRQMEFVLSRDTASLIKLLAAKQSLISALQEIERDLSPFSSEQPERRVWKTEAARTRCAEQATESSAMLREIVELERQGVDQMTIHRNQIADQLHQFHAAVDVRNAYQAQR
jgi:hypothetical protein